MNGPYLLDTNIWIALIRRHPGVVQRFLTHSPDELRLSWIALGELETGRALQNRDEDPLGGLVANVTSNVIDASVAREFGKLHALLRTAGTIIGHNDMWIAAEALRYDQTVVTANVSEFGRVPGLRVENWMD